MNESDRKSIESEIEWAKQLRAMLEEFGRKSTLTAVPRDQLPSLLVSQADALQTMVSSVESYTEILENLLDQPSEF